jgi:hypothetical protein
LEWREEELHFLACSLDSINYINRPSPMGTNVLGWFMEVWYHPRKEMCPAKVKGYQVSDIFAKQYNLLTLIINERPTNCGSEQHI